jgi:hypothetical protein
MRRSESGRAYISSDSRTSLKVRIRRDLVILACLAFTVSPFLAGRAYCAGPDIAPQAGDVGCRPADIEFRAVWAEIELAKEDQPYMVLDLGGHHIDLRLKGVLLWSCPITYDRPDSEVALDMKSWLGGMRNPPVELLTAKHLYTYKDRFPDSVLAVVARVAKVDPENLQRYEPGHFKLRFGRRLVMDVRTDAEASPASWFRNAVAAMRDVLLAPVTEAKIRVRMKPEDALTLYRAARPRLPVIICTTKHTGGS